MDDNFSPRVKDVIAYSKEEALRLGHDFIGTEHLMLGLLRDGGGKAISILDALSVDLEHLRRKVEIYITEQGLTELKTIDNVVARIEKEIAQKLSLDQQEEFYQFLNTLQFKKG